MPQTDHPKELVYPGQLKKGNSGAKVRQLQEWLSLNGHALAVDGDFGPATHAALSAFQDAAGLGVSGKLTKTSFEHLTAPMTRALASLETTPADLGAAVIAVAEQHLAEHPREVGGQNMGPWVRLYMDGNQGNDWPWCAGFVSFVLRQACSELGRATPVPKTFSCDILAMKAGERNLFVREQDRQSTGVAPGSIFLNRRVAGDWVHTGFVVEAEGEVFRTIEGNTNDEGSREGYEVCARTRGYKKKDFVRLEAPA